MLEFSSTCYLHCLRTLFNHLVKHTKTATLKQGTGALQAPPPAPLAQQTESEHLRHDTASQYDAARALACARRHNDATRCNGIGISIWPTMCEHDVIHKK